VVEDALQPAVTAAATTTTATSRDGRRLTRTTFDAGLRIIADFRRSVANRARVTMDLYAQLQKAAGSTSALER
jgi:hypothetical protein